MVEIMTILSNLECHIVWEALVLSLAVGWFLTFSPFYQYALRIYSPNMRICSELNSPVSIFFDVINRNFELWKDIEIGRCIWKYLNIGCTQSVETKDLFFNNFNDVGFGYKPRIGQISKYLVRSAITFHPNKDPIWQFETYSQIIRSEIEDFKAKERVIRKKATFRQFYYIHSLCHTGSI